MIQQSSSSNNRGQLFILTAFILAISFLLIAFALNVAIFVENSAGRATETDSKYAEQMNSLVEMNSDRVILSLQDDDLENPYADNKSDRNYTTLEKNFNDSMRQVSSITSREPKKYGAANITPTTLVKGTEIEQAQKNEFTRDNETNKCNLAPSSCDWILTKDTSNIRSMNMTIDQEETKRLIVDDCETIATPITCINDSTATGLFGLTDPYFTVEITKNGNEKVKTYIFEECKNYDVLTDSCGTNSLRMVTLNMDNNTVIGDCKVVDNDRNEKLINYSNGTMNGTKCNAVSEFSNGANKTGANTNFSLQYRNVTTINGSYNLVVDEKYQDLKLWGNYNTDDNRPADQPTIYHAIYSTEIRTSYEDNKKLFQYTITSEPEKVV